MAKLTVSYLNEIEKINILEGLSKTIKINHITKPKKSGNYYRVYIFTE